MKFNSIQSLRAEGFVGFKNIKDLFASRSGIPEERGVYLVLYLNRNQPHPKFASKGVGGFFKGKDPNESVTVLDKKWIDGATVAYIGRSDSSIRERVSTLLDFGQGKPVAHWGGRYIWQIQNYMELVVCWKTCSVVLCSDACSDKSRCPNRMERELLEEFKAIHGRWPFANIKGPDKEDANPRAGTRTVKEGIVSSTEYRFDGTLLNPIVKKERKPHFDSEPGLKVSSVSDRKSRIGRPPIERIIIDGSNVAHHEMPNRSADVYQLMAAYDQLLSIYGFKQIKILIGPGLRHSVTERDFKELLKKFEDGGARGEEKMLYQAPAGENDDSFIIDYAIEHDSLILSNDLYRDHIERHAGDRVEIQRRLVKYMIMDGDLIISRFPDY